MSAASTADDGSKLHPMSVPIRSVSRSLSTGSLFFFVGFFTSPGNGGTNLAVVGGMALLGIVVGIAYEFAYYQRFRYRLTADTFDVTSGVLSRRDREIPLRRVQNVDVRRNVLQRAVGVAAVHVETAGGGETEVTLRYVDETEATRLQRQLRDGSSDRGESTTGGAGEPTTEGDDRDGEVLFEIRPNELAVLSVFTIDPGASVLATIALSFASGFEPRSLLPIDLLEAEFPGTGAVALAWVLLVFLLAAWILSAALTFNRYYDFRLTRVGDELRYERGLLQRYSGTIPLEKVQTLTIRESVPFRWFGYAALAVETAGYAPGQSGSRGTESAIPLAERDRVYRLARSVEPFESVAVEGIPRRARERYAVRYGLVLAGLLGLSYALARYTAVVDNWFVPAVLGLLIPVAAHCKWANRGRRVGDRHFLVRTGFWRRTTKVVPYYRIQSVVYSQTIFQRRRRLASVTADTASSAAFFGRAGTAHDLDAGRAIDLQETLDERLQARLLERKRRRSVGSQSEDDGSSAAEETDSRSGGGSEGDRGGDEERRSGEETGDDRAPGSADGP